MQKKFIAQLKKGEAHIEGIGTFSVRNNLTPKGKKCKKIHFKCDKKVLAELN